MATTRILFVDDEPNILSGLRRMLRSKRDDWDMNFVNSGAEALTFMDGSAVDVVVSDMRMPAMDGGQLLSIVQEKYPATIRLILSGQCDQEAVFRSIGPSHQFLSKPCNGPVIEDAITRALALRNKLADKKLLALISRIPSLPTAPQVYVDLLGELKSEEPNINTIASIVSRDVALTAKLLQLAHSAYFANNCNVRSVLQAINMIGLDIVRALVLNHGLATVFGGDGRILNTVWRESVECAALSQAIAKDLGLSEEELDNAFVAGLLHDTGILIVNSCFNHAQIKIEKLIEEAGMPLFEAERSVLGATHADIGAYLLGIWGLPNRIIEPIAFHHEPRQCPARGITTLAVVYVADQLLRVKSEDIGSIEAFGHWLDLDYLADVGIAGRLPEWSRITEKQRDVAARA